MAPIPETLFAPNQMVAFACRRAGILPFGFPASIADYSDAQVFTRTVKLASQLGFVGAFCIHPSQAHMLNEGFSPSSEELEHATGLLAAFAEAEREGRGAFAYKGKMVDPPVVARAEELLRRADAIAARNS
jgi:citrate lyase subunit beta/citryl-CoA lyase